MKTSIIYRYLLLSAIFLISLAAKSQCPFTASITTMDAGGCGNSNGSVYFTFQEETAGSIAGSFYLVYKSDGTTLITSSTNTNREVSLPSGSYVAEVVVQCVDNKPQASWRQNFTIKQTTDNKDFAAKYNSYSSRITTLNAYPTAMLRYDLSGTGPYTVDIMEYPAEYVGPRHFENVPNGAFMIEKVAAGNYKVRFTNGCMVTTDGPRTVVKVRTDLPTSYNPSATSGIVNTQGGGVYQGRPTTDYNTIYVSLNGAAEPNDYWNKTISPDYYEYAAIIEEEGEVINSQTLWSDLRQGYLDNPITTKYTIGEMYKDRNKSPTVYIRLKKTNQMKKQKMTVTLSNPDNYFQIIPSPINCSNVDMSVSLDHRNVLTYPLKLQVMNFNRTVTLKEYTVTEADMKGASYYFIKLQNIDISAGYVVKFTCTGDPNEVIVAQSNLSSLGDRIILRGNRLLLSSSYCQSELAYVTYNEILDLRGAKIKYTGSIPLADDVLQEFSVPSDLASRPSIMFTPKVGGGAPWAANVSECYTPMPAGTYTWDISIPCGSGYTTYTKSVTLTAPNVATISDASKFDPKIVSSSSCGFVEISLGEFSNLSKVFTDYTNSTSYILCTLNTDPYLGPRYTYVPQSGGVFYDGDGDYYFQAKPANAIYTNPKIRISRPGTYYLIASPSFAFQYYDTPESCALVKKFVISDGDLEAKIDMDHTGAYYCAQDMSTGVVFVQRKGTNTGNDFIFRVRNSDLSYDKTVTSAEPQIAFNDINVALHGTEFSISVESANNCTTTPAVATLNLNEINNSAAFITQDIASDCKGTFDLVITGNAYLGASYKWKDNANNILSNTNELRGKFATGIKLYLDVVFTSKGPTGTTVPCGSWTKEYIVTGQDFTEIYWRSNAVDSDWNNPQNWNKRDGTRANGIPSICSDVFIPATVKNFYPDLEQASPEAKSAHIQFEFGGQLYNQHKLNYDHAFVSYNFGYYRNLTNPAPSTLVQPTHSVAEVTASADYKAAISFSSLPTMSRARWYMLAAPIKGMFMGDFQLAAKPYMVQRTYKSIAPTAEILVKDGFAVTYDSSEPLASTNNSVSIWAPPHGKAIGAEDQKVLEDLNGTIIYPYFKPFLKDDAILNARLDVTFDEATRVQSFKQFELGTLALSDAKTVTRLANSSRFIYEDDVTHAIPADGTYKLTIAADNKHANGEIMIGNPYMAPLDFDKFVVANAGVIKGSYKIIVDGVTKKYDQSNPGASNGLSKFIAAQQSFIITLSNPAAAATLKFPITVIAAQDATTIKTKVL